MINKTLIKKRFKKSLTTYDDNAIVQKFTAKKLIQLLPKKQYNSIFEAGCATGILTREIKQHLNYKNYCANDIVEEAKTYIDKIIPENNFIDGDIEEIKLNNKYDLIISNACLQWCNDISKTIKGLINFLNKGGILAISIFGENNLKEIADIFGIKNNYKLAEIRSNFKNIIYFEEETIILQFDTPYDALKHLKHTGVNAVKEMKFTKSTLKHFEEKYKNKYTQNGKITLTYNPVYIIISSNE